MRGAVLLYEDRYMLVTRVRALWSALSATTVTFPDEGQVEVVVSAASLMCPPGWCGLVTVNGAAVVTVPHERSRATVVRGLAGLSMDQLTDPEVLKRHLTVEEWLGPAALAYLAGEDFIPVPGAVDVITADSDELATFLASCPGHEVEESGIGDVTSPVFVVREKGVVVAACGYRIWLTQAAHLGILTSPECRGRGLARQAATAAVAEVLAAGLLPQWRARMGPSRRVAQSLGFTEMGRQLSFWLR